MILIGRSLNILDYALSLLLRKKLKNVAIIVVFTAVIFLLSSFQLLTSSLTQVARDRLSVAPDITVQQMVAGRQVPLKIEPEEELKSIFGITSIRKRVWGYYFDEKNGANYTVIGAETLGEDGWLDEALEWGRLPEKPGEVVLSAAVADNMQLGGRKNFSLFRPDLSMASFERVGQFKKGTGLLTDDLVLMSLEDGRNLFAMNQDEMTDVIVEVANKAEVDTIARKISDHIPGSRVVTKTQILKTYDVVFSFRSGVGSICLLTSLFAFIILAWDRASGISPDEKREMGILKVTGWQTADLMVLRFWESAIISFIAVACGYSLAWFHIDQGNALLLRPMMLGWSVLRPDIDFTVQFSLADFLLIATCSILPYLVATIIPAWKSAMVRPDSVM